MMEAMLAVDTQEEPTALARLPQEPSASEEIAFPSVTAAEETLGCDTLFGETPPPTINQMAFSGDFPPGDLDLDAALAARARARAHAEANLQPQHQGGPGEKDVAEWLRLPQQ